MTTLRALPRLVVASALVASLGAVTAPAAHANAVQDYVDDFLDGREQREVLLLGHLLIEPGAPVPREAPGEVAAAAGDEPAEAAAPAPAPAAKEPKQPYAFAERNQLELVTPVARPVYVGFHEAWYRGAVRLRPLGQAAVIDNPRKPPPPQDEEGFPYGILRTRGRGPSPTSAVDIQVRHNEPIRAAVTGKVVEARRYRLYGRYPDAMVVIRPDAARDHLVTMLHVKGLRVNKGQHVEAGKTVVAKRASSFPFASQIDRYSKQRLPHVHVEVRRR